MSKWSLIFFSGHLVASFPRSSPRHHNTLCIKQKPYQGSFVSLNKSCQTWKIQKRVFQNVSNTRFKLSQTTWTWGWHCGFSETFATPTIWKKNCNSGNCKKFQTPQWKFEGFFLDIDLTGARSKACIKAVVRTFGLNTWQVVWYSVHWPRVYCRRILAFYCLFVCLTQLKNTL